MSVTRKVNIVFCFDHAFYRQAGVAIASLLRCSYGKADYAIFCVCAKDVSESDRRELGHIVDVAGKDSDIEFLAMDDRFKDAFVSRGISEASYFRLSLPGLLTGIDKVIYADSDILFLKDISAVWETDLEGRLLAAVRDPFVNYKNNFDRHLRSYEYFKKNFDGLRGEYFNAGFMVMDLGKMRESGMERRWEELAKELFVYQDQDILNISCRGMIGYLPAKYNVFSGLVGGPHYPNLVADGILTSQDVADCHYDASVLHFTGEKPWINVRIGGADRWWGFVRKNRALFGKSFITKGVTAFLFWKTRSLYIRIKQKYPIGFWTRDLCSEMAFLFKKNILFRMGKIKVVNERIPDGDPVISVVIPCFNYGKYVESAIDSVLVQTVENIEIIVVDGGSTDGVTRRTLKALRKPKTRIFFREGRHLVGDNRNYGIRKARGRYICCLDADDMLEPSYFEKALRILEGEKYDILYSSLQFFGNSDRGWDVSNTSFEKILIHNAIPTTAVFSRNAWKQGGGYRDWPIGDGHVPEDWDFWARLLGMGFRAKPIRERLVRYRIHDAGLTAMCSTTIEFQRSVINSNNSHYADSAYKRIREKNLFTDYIVSDPYVNIRIRK
ncbi:MAG: glycosyltransferase [Candidatus Moraniibacteriota bacterium]